MGSEDVAALAALPIWLSVKLAMKFDSPRLILYCQRVANLFGRRFEKILVYAHIGRLDLSGLRKDLDGMQVQSGFSRS